MEKENQILDILRLYEYAMSIGKSLNYQTTCDDFLTLLLKRRNLNAGWILSEHDGRFFKEFSIPQGTTLNKKLPKELERFLKDTKKYTLVDYEDHYAEICPITIESGSLAIFCLGTEGYLFLYAKGGIMNQKKLGQLLPVINKFAVTLEACKAHENQQFLLKRLEERNKELNDYAHIVSHDLKSPLRNIDALVSWVQEDHGDELSEGALSYINQIGDHIQRMESLVSGILEYSSIRFKDFKTSLIDLNKVIEGIIKHTLVPQHIRIEVQKNFPIIQGDLYRTQQLFQNLIGNAIKYNDKEQGLIKVGFTERNNRFEYFVQDNGKGIAPKYHDKIFKVFQKLDNNKDSTGIGLSIVQKIVSGYGGEIRLESELGKGTTFYFTLRPNS